MDDLSMDNCNDLLTERQVAEKTGLSMKTLQAWRWQGNGPQYVKFGKRSVRYQVGDVLDWIKTNKRSSTSDPGQKNN
jgi:predicted DNA-binding transcriptional regulator AlpA